MVRDSRWDRVKFAYWKRVPYDWRPGQVWYRLKCRFWHKYSTVRPRWLGHTWVDRDELLEHVMFEVLGRYLEAEAGPADPYEATAADPWAATRRELRELWRWWTEEYLPFDARDPLAGIECPRMIRTDHPDGTCTVRLEYSSDEARRKANQAHLDHAQAEHALGVELTTRLHRLVDARKGLWS